MPTHEILREKWLEFFQTFTSDHEGWLVNLGIKGSHPDQEVTDPEVRGLPLREITADLKDKENTIVISVGLSSGHDVMRHAIPMVSHVRLIQSDEAPDTVVQSALQIESMDGLTTTISLKATVPQP